MPSLNVKAYIEECIKSVINQTMKNIEVIFVDAGSTDGTLEVIERYAKKDERISILMSDRKSYGYQVNIGLDNAHGEYVGILETDDMVADNMYELLADKADANRADIVKGGYVSLLKNGSTYYKLRQGALDTEKNNLYGILISPQDHPELHESDNHIWTGIYRKSFLSENNIRVNESEGAAFQDIGYTHDVLCCATSALYIGEALYYYRLHRIGASTGSKKCLRFIRQEYERIFSRLSAYKGIVNDIEKHRKYIIVRMAHSFICECEKVLRIINYDNENPLFIDDYQWCQSIISQAIDDNVINELDFDANTWFRLLFLLKSIRGFTDYARIENMIKMERIERIIKSAVGREIIICGAGTKGKEYAKALIENGIRIRAFVDNNENKQGWADNGIDVIKAREAVGLVEECCILIPLGKYTDEFYNQLIEMGVKPTSICRA